MNQQPTYDVDQLFTHEHHKLGKVTSLLTESFTKVQGIINKFSQEPQYREIVSELNDQVKAFQSRMADILKEPINPNQRSPFQELTQLRGERQQGFQRLTELQSENQRLQDQQQASNRLIEELKAQLNNNSINNDINQNNKSDDVPYSSPLHFDDPQDIIIQLTNELETAQLNVGQLRQSLTEMQNENKRLSNEVLGFRDQITHSYNPNLNRFNLFENGNRIQNTDNNNNNPFLSTRN